MVQNIWIKKLATLKLTFNTIPKILTNTNIKHNVNCMFENTYNINNKNNIKLYISRKRSFLSFVKITHILIDMYSTNSTWSSKILLYISYTYIFRLAEVLTWFHPILAKRHDFYRKVCSLTFIEIPHRYFGFKVSPRCCD